MMESLYYCVGTAVACTYCLATAVHSLMFLLACLNAPPQRAFWAENVSADLLGCVCMALMALRQEEMDAVAIQATGLCVCCVVMVRHCFQGSYDREWRAGTGAATTLWTIGSTVALRLDLLEADHSWWLALSNGASMTGLGLLGCLNVGWGKRLLGAKPITEDFQAAWFFWAVGQWGVLTTGLLLGATALTAVLGSVAFATVFVVQPEKNNSPLKALWMLIFQGVHLLVDTVVLLVTNRPDTVFSPVEKKRLAKEKAEREKAEKEKAEKGKTAKKAD